MPASIAGRRTSPRARLLRPPAGQQRVEVLSRLAPAVPAAGPPQDLLQALLRYAYAGPGVRRWQITRLAMYRALEGRLAALDGPERRCLCISLSEGLARIAGLAQATLLMQGECLLQGLRNVERP